MRFCLIVFICFCLVGCSAPSQRFEVFSDDERAQRSADYRDWFNGVLRGF